MKTTLDIQHQLKGRGFDPGLLDGDFGPGTRSAVMRFQRTISHLVVDGIPGPETIAALFYEPIPDESGSLTPWMDVAIRRKGLNENRDYAELSTFLMSDGKYLGDPRKYPWCGDLVSTCLALTLAGEKQPANPYLARNWLKFGIECEPRYGAVAVYWRGSKAGSSGHVAFLAGEDNASGAWVNLGGNQSNSISITSLTKSRALGFRWPRTVPLGKTRLPQMRGGKLSTNEA